MFYAIFLSMRFLVEGATPLGEVGLLKFVVVIA